MQISVLTILPHMFDAVLDNGIAGRAFDSGALAVKLWDLRDFTVDKHRTVDDRPYGGGPGMLMKAEPLARGIDTVKQENSGPVIYLSPQGQVLNQKLLAELAELPQLILLAGRYEGIDERIIESRVDREISIGDYVLAGGELAAMVLIEGIARLLPGVLGNHLSAQQDSFSGGLADSFAGCLLDCPHYTRPQVFEDREVPAVLLGGNHDKIQRWRQQQALGRTDARRPELLCGRKLNREQTDLLETYRLEKNHEQLD